MKPAWLYIYIYIYIVYCHLGNKKASSKVAGHKFIKFDNKIRDRTILKSKCVFGKITKIFLKGNFLKEKSSNIYFSSMGLSFCVLYEKILYKSQRAGP